MTKQCMASWIFILMQFLLGYSEVIPEQISKEFDPSLRTLDPRQKETLDSALPKLDAFQKLSPAEKATVLLFVAQAQADIAKVETDEQRMLKTSVLGEIISRLKNQEELQDEEH